MGSIGIQGSRRIVIAVVDHFGYSRQVASTALANFDRFLSKKPSVLSSKKNIQLLMTTCLYLSVKTADDKPKGLPLSFFATMSNGLFVEADIESMELELFDTLEWHVFPPTPELFCLHLLQDAHGLQVANSQALYVLDNSLLDFYFCSHLPSHVALAAIAYTLRHWFSLDALVDTFDYCDWDMESLEACHTRMHHLMERDAATNNKSSPNDARAFDTDWQPDTTVHKCV